MLGPRVLALGLFAAGASVLVPSMAASSSAERTVFDCKTTGCANGNCYATGSACTCYCNNGYPHCDCAKK